MKTVIALTVLVLTALPQSAYALRITSGFVASAHGISAPWAGLLGEGFNVWGGEEFGVDPRPAFGIDPYTWTITFRAPSVVTVGSEECRANEIGETCGQLTLTSPGLAMPAGWPRTTVFAATVPFTATGFLLVGGNRYDLTGEGWLTGQRCLELAACGIVPIGLPTIPSVRVDAHLYYTFTVAEPETILLPVMFALTVLTLAFVRRGAAG